MRARHLLAVFAAAVSFSCSWTTPSAQAQKAAPAQKGAADPEVARIGKRSIRKSDLAEAYRFITPENRPNLSSLDAREAFVRDLVNKELLLEEARRLGLDKDPGYLEEARRRTRDYLVSALQEQITDKLPTPEDADVDSLARKLDYRYHCYLLGAVTKDPVDIAHTRLTGGEQWGAVERDWRNDPDAEFEEKDTATPEILPFEIREAMMALEPGKCSPVIPLEGAFYLVYMESKEAASRDTAQCREAAEATLQKDIWRRALDAFDNEIQAREHYRRDEAVIKRVARMFKESAAPGETPGRNPEHWPAFSDTLRAVSLATWDSDSLRVGDFLQRLWDYPDPARPDLGSRQQLRILVDIQSQEFFQVAEARRRKLDQRPDVARRFRRMNERRLIREVYLRLTEGVTVPDDSIHAYYQAHASELKLPDEYHLYAVVRPDSAAADSVYQLLGGPAEIGDLARKLSIHKASASQGGDLGWVKANAYPELYDAVVRMQAHTLAGPLKALGGWAVLRAEATRGTRAPTFEEARGAIAQRLTGDAQDKKLADWLAAKSANYVQLFPERLKDLTIP